MADAEQRPWVVVSGAGGSLGSALVKRFAASGHPILALDVNADSLANLLPATGSVTTRSVDLADPDQFDLVLDEVFPRRVPIWLLANAVGAIWNEPALSVARGRLTPHGLETFEKVIRANLTTAFVTATRIAARMARTGGGAIVNFSSISASGMPGQIAYSAAKAGIEGMTKAMAQELGPLQVRVNAIAPGFVNVPSTHAAMTTDALAVHVRRTPVGRLGSLDDIGDAVEYLARSTFISGKVLEIDGGLRI